MPRASIDAQRAVLDRDASQRLRPLLFEVMLQQQHATRESVAAGFAVDVAQVALMHTTHSGINTALWGLELGPGDSVVTTDREHPGVQVPLRVLHDRRGIDVRVATWPADSSQLPQALAQAVDATTRAVVVSHVDWLYGAVAPLADIVAACQPVPVIVDGAQGAGAVRVDAADGWTAYSVSGQKWMCGPNGSGALLMRDPAQLAPTFGGFFATTNPAAVADSPYQPDGRRLEFSQEAELPLAGLAASVPFVLGEVGVHRAQAHSAALNIVARKQLATLVDTGAVVELHGHAHLLALRIPGRAEQLAASLATDGIYTRNVGPDLLRLSLGFWNTPDDVTRATSRIAELAAATV
jgi:L-cysteine/cystine lyase